MEFAIGVIIGILACIFVVITLVFLRPAISPKLKVIQKQIEKAGPKPKGYIIDPPTEADEAREKVIEKNRQKGQDTPIEELR